MALGPSVVWGWLEGYHGNAGNNEHHGCKGVWRIWNDFFRALQEIDVKPISRSNITSPTHHPRFAELSS